MPGADGGFNPAFSQSLDNGRAAGCLRGGQQADIRLISRLAPCKHSRRRDGRIRKQGLVLLSEAPAGVDDPFELFYLRKTQSRLKLGQPVIETGDNEIR